MFGSVNHDVTFAQKIIAIKSTAAKNPIHVTARVAQVFFGTGCALSAIGVYIHFNPLLSGGSFILHGSMVLVRMMETVLCYDLARLSSNIASIFHSTILSQTAKKHLGSSVPANLAIDTLVRFENESKLPETTNIKDPKELTGTLTQGTVTLKYLNPYIEKSLAKR